MDFLAKIKSILHAREKTHSPLSASEILTALVAKSDEAKRVFREKTIAPDTYTIHLSEADMAGIRPIVGSLSNELLDALKQHARRKKYTFNTADVTIRFHVDDATKPGKVRITGAFGSGRRQPAGISTVVLKIVPAKTTGHTVTLTRGTYVIGRGGDADIQVPSDDRLASKHHCRITVEEDKIQLADLNSANGTLCNQVPVVGTTALAANSRLMIGTTCIEVLIES